jgi:hypothetical protein
MASQEAKMPNAIVLAIAVTGLLAFDPNALASADQPPSDPARAEAPAPESAPVKTGKEHLSDKASDEQRVDNCNVPLDRRGPKIRPDECPNGRDQVPTN